MAGAFLPTAVLAMKRHSSVFLSALTSLIMVVSFLNEGEEARNTGMNQSMPRTRPAILADLESLVQMRHDLHVHMKATTPALFDLPPVWHARKLAFNRACLEDRDRHLVVLCDPQEDEILGLGLGSEVQNSDLEPARFGSIDDVWIEPQWRRHGMGSKIVADLLRFFDSRGIDRLTLSFAIGNAEAEAFWAKLGFRPALVTANGQFEEVKSSLACS